MRSKTAFAAMIGLAFVSASDAFAQSAAPGSAPPRPGRVSAVPLPPPGGPDKFTTRTAPPGATAQFARPRTPKPVDDIAGDRAGRNAPTQAGHGGNTCFPQQISSDGTTIPANETACGKNLSSFCAGHNGGMVQNDDGSVTCSIPN